MNIIFFVDEIQMSDETANPYNPAGKKITFYDALNDLRSLPNLDVYVTGSNSKMLSSDILTEFRGPQRRDPRPPAQFFGISARLRLRQGRGLRAVRVLRAACRSCFRARTRLRR
ncbi:hypothetical protein [uncultured Cloacibacillus sp.]|uniref:hypothetical protein n=1 Tax=uncultured Cloacibacillus sp. TaxID=889794 RepID=UPI0032085585